MNESIWKGSKICHFIKIFQASDKGMNAPKLRLYIFIPFAMFSQCIIRLYTGYSKMHLFCQEWYIW